MFGRLSENIVRFLIKKRVVSLALFLGAIGLLLEGTRHLNLQEDLYAIFPKGEQYQKFNQVVQQNGLNKQVVFSLGVGTDLDAIPEQLDQLVTDLKSTFPSELGAFVVERSIDEIKLIEYLQSAAIVQLNAADYTKIAAGLSPDSIERAIAKTADRLQGGEGFFLRSLLATDPLGITTEKLTQANPFNDTGSYRVKDGLLFTKDERQVVFFATLLLDLNNTDQLVAFNNKLTDYLTARNEKIKEQPVNFFGTFQIVAENARQIKQDTTRTSLISLALILLLLTLYYRSILIPLYFILPALFGILFGCGIVGYLHPNISAISLATASVLIGIVLDYSLHFFTHYKHTGNLLQTVREISAPMILGSFTSVAAMGALLFADSVVLQDFGFIALCVLFSSALFTVFILPVLLDTFRIRLPQTKEVARGVRIPKGVLRLSIFLILLGATATIWNGTQVSFDSDINNLSFHSADLKKKEESLSGINPEKQKKIYILAQADTRERAKDINARIYTSLVSLKDSFGIRALVSNAPYMIPQRRIEEAQMNWTQFWSDKKEATEATIRAAGRRYEFSENAFSPFFTWIRTGSIDTTLGNVLSEAMGLNNLVYVDAGQTTFLTSLVLDRDKLQACKASLRQIEGAYILDIADLTDQMLLSVQNDFNYLLLFSVLLVFGSLLVVYGRIELALFALFPLALSWILIVGLTDLLDIKFNFVNIVITTFIFGLGDDFSIFTTDGLIQKYATGKKMLQSYRSAIILSGLTTIIGTGALFFAKHPAIYSISLIGVLGISCILFVTLYIQPYLFNLLITNRVKRGRAPITFFNLIYSSLLFLYFFAGSILLNVFLIVILLPFPASRERKRAFLNFLISKLAKSTLYMGVHVQKRILYPERLDFNKPAILVANHSSFLDILLALMLNPKVLIVVKSWVYHSPIFGLFIRYAGYPFIKNDILANLDFVKKRIDEGYSILVFPEGTRSVDGEIKRFHKGAFWLAKELELEIQPIVLIGAHEVNPKNDILISKGQLIVLPLDRLSSPANETYSQFAKRINALMRQAYEAAKIEYGNVDFWGPSILKNFILKGPVLEWYVRIKWKLEKENYDWYARHIGNRRVIYDLGCGFGYLSYYLHYQDPNRIITAVDYDTEKIDIAAHGRTKNNHLKFEAADIRSYTYESMDVVFLNDVLHYLTKADQRLLLDTLARRLNEDGILFIREGLAGSKQRFKRMQFTEFLSTKVLKFNKKINPLDFVAESDMIELAAKYGFSLQKIEQSRTTSNALLIMKKMKQSSGT